MWSAIGFKGGDYERFDLFLRNFLIANVTFVSAQTRKPNKPSSEIRLFKDKPSVYISYERSGKREPLDASESNEGLWLRLHNNTRWAIWLPSFGVPQGAGELGIHYDLEKMPTSVGRQEKPGERDCLQPYSLPHPASFKSIMPGKSVLFSVPSERLTAEHMLRVFFFYDWEQLIDVVTDREPKHFVYFSFSEIPKEKTR